MKRFFTAFALFMLISIPPAVAGPLKTAEDYFNNLTTFEADFRQFTVNVPGVTEGKFYINRPSQFLWQYVYPDKQKIISTGSSAYFVDEETNQVTQLPRNSGFLKIFTSKNVSFNQKDIHVIQQTESDKDIEITLKPEQENITEITFILQKNPTQLQQIVSKDSFGDSTIVVFTNISEGEKLEDELFDFTPPQYEGEEYN